MLKRFFYTLCVSVLIPSSFIASACASDAPLYTDYQEIEGCINGIYIDSTSEGILADYFIIPGRGENTHCLYTPQSGWVRHVIPDEDSSEDSSEDSTKESPLFSNARHTVYKRTNGTGDHELILKADGSEKSLMLLSRNPEDDEESNPIHLNFGKKDILFFNSHNEQVGIFDFSSLTKSGDPTLTYIYKSEDFKNDVFEVTHIQTCNSTLYFLKTVSGRWPQVWSINMANDHYIPTPVETHLPFYLTGFDFHPTGDGEFITSVDYRHNFRDYTVVGGSHFTNFPPHNDEGANNVQIGHYGAFHTYKTGLFCKHYFKPYNANENSLLLLDEEEHFKPQFPLLAHTVQPVTHFVSNKDIKIPVHIYQWEKRAQVPLVLLWLHGGPERYSDPKFISSRQYFVQQLNCVLVDINYRGSTEYTEALSSLAGKIESGAMSDVLCVMDYVKQHVPQAKFALYGHSFGGYLASLILTSEHSEKFCGGVSASGFYDWQEDFKFITDKQGEAFAISNFRSRFGFVPSIDKEQATKLSITSRLKELKVPLHVVHGGKDDTCPLAQVQLLETAKKQTSQSLLDIHIFENADHSFSPEDKDSANEAFKGMLAFYRKIGC